MLDMFLGWAQHQQDIEDAINILFEAYKSGQTEIIIETETDMTQEEYELIADQARAKYERWLND